MLKLFLNILGGGYISRLKKEGSQYFAPKEFGVIDKNEVFVDCGAYFGDSIERYIWCREGTFKKIIAFEPNNESYRTMCNRMERLKREWNLGDDKIELYPYGVSSKNYEGVLEAYDANNGASSKYVKGTNGEKSRLISLDEFVKEQYTFLKADIESYEYKMILGAEKGIKKYKPLIAVSIYHNAVDLYTIPLLIKSIVEEYKMTVRHHSDTLAETVLYCWCE